MYPHAPSIILKMHYNIGVIYVKEKNYGHVLDLKMTSVGGCQASLMKYDTPNQYDIFQSRYGAVDGSVPALPLLVFR